MSQGHFSLVLVVIAVILQQFVRGDVTYLGQGMRLHVQKQFGWQPC